MKVSIKNNLQHLLRAFVSYLLQGTIYQACPLSTLFIRGMHWSSVLILTTLQWFLVVNLKSPLCKLYGLNYDLVNRCEISVTNNN